MNEQYRAITTEVGVIAPKRTAIYLDSFEQVGNSLNLVGEINSRWCEKKIKDWKWYKYQLNFNAVKKYKVINIDEYYKMGMHTTSVFSEVLFEITTMNSDKTIILETYDWVYIIVCENYNFSITGYR